MQTVTDKASLETLQQVTITTLEEFAFMFAEACTEGEQAPPPADSDFITATVEFKGEYESGRVLAAMPMTPCQEMAENVLGIEPEELPEQATTDAMQEWANILTGALIADLFGVEKTFMLSSPLATREDASAITALQQAPGTLSFNIDGDLLLVRLERG